MCGDKMPNVIWCSPDCSTYSKLGIQFHRIKKGYTPIPISDYAKYCDENNRKMFNFITSLDLLWFFENPAALMRYMDFTERLPRYTTTYCQYGEQIRKETDIFTNHPNPDFKKPCKNGDPCHLPVGRFGKYGNGVQNGINSSFERAKLPKLFCEHIFKICDEYYKGD